MGLFDRLLERFDERLEKDLEAFGEMMKVENPDPTYRKYAFLALWLLRLERLQRWCSRLDPFTVAKFIVVVMAVLWTAAYVLYES